MIAFIIPLKSKIVSKDWDLTSKLLSDTLNSIFRQSCQEFTVIIVGHEKPNNIDIDNPKISFFKSPFDLLLKEGKQKIDSYLDIDRILDKLQKIHIGLFEASKFSPDYYMVLDADDILHKNFVKFVTEYQDPNGYLVKKGYQYYPLSHRLIKNNSLEKICGSTTVVHKNHIVIPELGDQYSFFPILWNKFSHSAMEDYFVSINSPLKIVPFYGILYTLNHGQNASDEFRKSFKSVFKRWVKILLFGKGINKKIKSDFSLIYI